MGLTYLRNRYYDSSIGAFISEDSIRYGLNWYVYCSSNPVMFVDPFGLSGESRYVIGDSVRLRSDPGANSTVYDLLSKGTEVNYNGNKTGVIDGHMWANVTVNDITGWVAADYLGTAPPGSVDESSTWNKLMKNTCFYIYDQEDPDISYLSYGNWRIGENGCELIAVYNALVHLGDPIPFKTVISDAENTDGVLWLGGKFGSHYENLGLLLDKYNHPYVSSEDRNNFNSMLYDGGTYIVSYRNKGKLSIHTVMFTCDSNGGIEVYNGENKKCPKSYSSLDNFLSRQGEPLILYGVK